MGAAREGATARGRRSPGAGRKEAPALAWFGVLGAPAAWIVHLLIATNLAELGCSEGNRPPGQVLGISVGSVIFLISLVLAGVSLGAGVVSWRCWRKAVAGDPSTGGRARWMAAAGVMGSVLFSLAILAGLAPGFFLESCRRGP